MRSNNMAFPAIAAGLSRLAKPMMDTVGGAVKSAAKGLTGALGQMGQSLMGAIKSFNPMNMMQGLMGQGGQSKSGGQGLAQQLTGHAQQAMGQLFGGVQAGVANVKAGVMGAVNTAGQAVGQHMGPLTQSFAAGVGGQPPAVPYNSRPQYNPPPPSYSGGAGGSPGMHPPGGYGVAPPAYSPTPAFGHNPPPPAYGSGGGGGGHGNGNAITNDGGYNQNNVANNNRMNEGKVDAGADTGTSYLRNKAMNAEKMDAEIEAFSMIKRGMDGAAKL
jgi:hypothetical protein